MRRSFLTLSFLYRRGITRRKIYRQNDKRKEKPSNRKDEGRISFSSSIEIDEVFQSLIYYKCLILAGNNAVDIAEGKLSESV